MKRVFDILMACLFIWVIFTSVGFAQTISTANEKYPLPIVASPIIEFPVMATPTITLGVTATVMPPLPVGSKGVIMAPTTNVDINYGGTNVVSGAGWPIFNASNPELIFTAAGVQPTIYFYATATGTTPVVRFTPFK